MCQLKKKLFITTYFKSENYNIHTYKRMSFLIKINFLLKNTVKNKIKYKIKIKFKNLLYLKIITNIYVNIKCTKHIFYFL